MHDRYRLQFLHLMQISHLGRKKEVGIARGGRQELVTVEGTDRALKGGSPTPPGGEKDDAFFLFP